MSRASKQRHWARYGRPLLLAAWFVWCSDTVHAALSKTGFLVVAPDRGFLGNQEIRTVFDDFKVTYPTASLIFIGRDYAGIGTPYSEYVQRALSELREARVTDLVAIPFFVSEADPLLQRVKSSLTSYGHIGTITWAQPMVDSYLIRQVVLDRTMELSRDPEHERVVLVGFGATNAANEQPMHRDMNKLVEYVARYQTFRESKVIVYYDQAASDAEIKNAAADTTLMQMAAKKGRTLAILATLGPNFDHSMALSASLKQKFHDVDVVFSQDEFLPHPNVLRWLKKTANAYLPATPAEMGVVIMPHGATQLWNDAVERVIAPLRAAYPIEMAYGMGDPGIIQDAVSRLEARNIRRIIFVRLYAMASHLQARTDYMLGLAELPVPDGHAGGHNSRPTPPHQIRSAALFASFGGYEESSDVSRILHERIVEISREPTQETVILVAHGEKTEEGNARWLSTIQAHIERLKQDPHCARLKAIRAATVREDWPEQREKAVNDVRRMIQDASQQGRALVIADRLYGAGPYRTLFEGLEYTLNDKGLAHPVLTEWLETGIARAARLMAQPLVAAPTSAAPAW
jgi:hypothetical protein